MSKQLHKASGQTRGQILFLRRLSQSHLVVVTAAVRLRLLMAAGMVGLVTAVARTSSDGGSAQKMCHLRGVLGLQLRCI